jgi:hypothetical protein
MTTGGADPAREQPNFGEGIDAYRLPGASSAAGPPAADGSAGAKWQGAGGVG